ncbi:hypothetical protein [Hymenobacter cellulosivorans]|nr:hypothetical protein [Hymenobacter cellulosivorans]
MKRVVRIGVVIFLALLAVLILLWSQIPDIDSSADIDASLGQSQH